MILLLHEPLGGQCEGVRRKADCQQWGFSGVSTFAHLQHTKCLTTTDTLFDIAILGVPFDTAVSYRPGMFSAAYHPLPFPLLPLSTLPTSAPLPSMLSPNPIFCEVDQSVLMNIRSTLRPPGHSRRLCPPNLLPRLQPPRRHKPLHILGLDP